MALDEPDVEWLQKLDTEPPDFEPEPWHGLYWDAWEALRFDRPYGAMGGEGYIPYSVLRQYAEDNGIDGEDFATFRRFMSAIDDEWLKHQAKKDGEASSDS